MGMCTMGIVAREIGKLFYAASNSYKFVGLFLLNQSDLNKMGPGAGLRFFGTSIC